MAKVETQPGLASFIPGQWAEIMLLATLRIPGCPVRFRKAGLLQVVPLA